MSGLRRGAGGEEGGLRAWSFAHYGGAGSLACAESSIHAAAKQVLAEVKAVMVPEVRVRASAKTEEGILRSREQLLDVQRTVRFDSCCIEAALGAIRVDVLACRGERKMAVEILVTHRVDEDKVAALKALGLPALEIDLPDFARHTDNVDFGALCRHIVDSATHRRWLHYPGADQATRELGALLDADVAKLDQQAREHVRRATANRLRAEAEYRALSLDEKERRLRGALLIRGEWPSFIDEPRFQAPALGHPTRIWQGLIYAQFVMPRPRKIVFTVEEAVEWITTRLGCSAGQKDPAGVIRNYLAFLCARHHLEREMFVWPDRKIRYSCLQVAPSRPLASRGVIRPSG